MVTLLALVFLGVSACKAGESQGGAGGFGGTGGEGGAGGTGGDAPACGTCAQVFTQGGVPCDDSASEAYNALLACACGPCATACGASLCASVASDQACGVCLDASCGAQHIACATH